MVWRKTLDLIKGSLGWKKSADWILTDRTQFDESESQGRKLQLVIGLDFGTAFTKVVIGEQRVRYGVPFTPYSDKSNPYLLPSALSLVGDSQECVLGFPTKAVRSIDDLKMRLIDRDFSAETRMACAAFLSLVFRFTRGWLLDNHKNTYKDRHIVWLVNIGLPTDSYHDQRLVDAYREITQVAWTVSVLPGSVSLERIQTYMGKPNTSVLPPLIRGRLLGYEYIKTFPEFAVQLVGYVRSPRRQQGLHTLLDVGAGTIDFTTFNIYKNKDGEDQFPIFARNVKPLGTRFLIEHRLGTISPKTYWIPSPFENVPHDSVFEKQLSLTSRELNDIDRPFCDKVAELIRTELDYTKSHRDPMSRHWHTGVPTFLCGGGAKVDSYLKIFHLFAMASPPFKIKANSLAVPGDLRAPSLPKDTYDRLSVAYGLSYVPYDIGTILRMEEIDDFQKGQARTEGYRDGYIDKDMI